MAQSSVFYKRGLKLMMMGDACRGKLKLPFDFNAVNLSQRETVKRSSASHFPHVSVQLPVSQVRSLLVGCCIMSHSIAYCLSAVGVPTGEPPLTSVAEKTAVQDLCFIL
ncbi:uncharacterized protein V6R79_007178 [Siganus canaliculatus]